MRARMREGANGINAHSRLLALYPPLAFPAFLAADRTTDRPTVYAATNAHDLVLR